MNKYKSYNTNYTLGNNIIRQTVTNSAYPISITDVYSGSYRSRHVVLTNKDVVPDQLWSVVVQILNRDVDSDQGVQP
jgi:hypothetical protein